MWLLLTRGGKCPGRRPRRPRTTFSATLALLGLAVVVGGAAEAREGTVVRGAQAPIGYTTELEPHLVLGPDGFIDGVNDSIAIGFGADFGHYSAAYGLRGYRDQCRRFEPGPAGTSVCTDVTSTAGTYNYLFLPVVMQWNFWFTDRWSAFGEPGMNLYYLGNHGFAAGPALYLGGRFRLSDRITLTARIGYPTLGIGVSFMM
jgi:hypothetical protein